MPLRRHPDITGLVGAGIPALLAIGGDAADTAVRTGDDVLESTPTAPATNYGPADPTRDTCPDDGGHDPTTTYTDYTDDAGMTELSPGQVTRIKEHVTLYRPGLLGAGLAGAADTARAGIDFGTGTS